MEVISETVEPAIIDGYVGELVERLRSKGLNAMAGEILSKYTSDDGGWRMIIKKRQHGMYFRGACLRKSKLILIVVPEPAVIAHELTHMIGGNEIDAETIENHLYTSSEGATPPDEQYDAWQFDILPGPNLVPAPLSKRVVGV